MLKAVMFDMDGVLIDSVASARRARTEVLARYGVDIENVPDPNHEAHKGSSVKTLLAAVNRHRTTNAVDTDTSVDVPIDEATFAKEIAGYIYSDLNADNVTADPALILFLQELRGHSIACAITSSGRNDSVNYKLSLLGIQPYFSVIVTGENVKEHKPHPEPYLATMSKLGVKPQNCIIFEDSAAGVAAGRAANVAVIGFTQYNDQKNPLAGTFATVHSWQDITYRKLVDLLKSS